MAFKPWHKHRPGIEGALEVWRASKTSANFKKLSDKISDAIDTEYVKKHDQLLVEVNDFGKAYSCMDQADMGKVLVTAGYETGNKRWIKQGIHCLNVLITLHKRGGLRDYQKHCSWIHGRTSRSKKVPGGTLNKHLVAIRDLALMANYLASKGQTGKANDFRTVAIEGIRQLGHSGVFPNFNDFVVKDKGTPVSNSWMYYAVAYDKRKGYHLVNAGKNAVYHVFCLRLIIAIHNALGDYFPLNELSSIKTNGISTVRWMYNIYKAKAAEDIRASSDVPVGTFAGVPLDKPILAQWEMNYFENYYS